MKKVTIGIQKVDQHDNVVVIPIVKQENPPEEIGLVKEPINPTV